MSEERRADLLPFAPRVVPVPSGFQSLVPTSLEWLNLLPCNVYLRQGTRGLLFARSGIEAREILDRMQRGAELLVRDEDVGLLRRAMIDRMGHVLANEALPPVERCRTAYAIALRVTEPVFTPGIDRDDLGMAGAAIDAIARRLAVDPDLRLPLIEAMERSSWTHTHAVNSAIYAVMVLRTMDNVTPDDVRVIGRGALFADLGMLRIPAEILDKAELEDEEWAQVRDHARLGADLLSRTVGYAAPYVHIVAEHHERIDGSGYPEGRREKEVPADSQLVGLVDVFDALTSSRPHRPALAPADALRVVRHGMRDQFAADLLWRLELIVDGWTGATASEARRSA